MLLHRLMVICLAGPPVATIVGCTPGSQDLWGQPMADGGQRPAQDKPAHVKDAPAPRISPETHYASGAMLEKRGDLIGAVDQYERAIAASPTLGKGYNRLGIVYVKLGRFAEAESILGQGIRVEPASAQLHNNLGYCYLLQEKFQAAETEFRTAVDLSPDYKRARMNLGIVLARTLRLRESAMEFARTVPASVAYYNVALICADMKEYDHAAHALREALRVNPEYAAAKDQLARVSALARQMPRRGDGSESVDQHLAGDPTEAAADAP